LGCEKCVATGFSEDPLTKSFHIEIIVNGMYSDGILYHLEDCFTGQLLELYALEKNIVVANGFDSGGKVMTFIDLV